MQRFSNKLSPSIRQKAQQLKRLQQAILASLPLDCHDHIHIAGIRDNQLIVLTDSPVWQTRLRLYSQSMLEALHQHANIKLNRVRIRLTPGQREIEEPPPEPRVLSPQSAQIIEQTARGVSDEALSRALLRLSRKAKSPE